MIALAIGKFDALHLGHLALAERAALVGEPLLLGFTGMAAVLGWPTRLPLVAPSERARILAQWSERVGKPVRVLEIPFATVRAMPPTDFVAFIHQQLHARALVVGQDFRFGIGRSGGVDDLVALGAQQGLGVSVVAPVLERAQPISSSRVRAALAAGDVALAAACLGRAQRVVGTVVRGDGRGRTLGMPTANCGERENQEPAPGVYAAWAGLGAEGGSRLPAAVNVGHLPTAGDGRPLTVEAHLIGYAGDCYGQRLALDFVARLRDERRFADLAALRAQLALDVAQARALLG